MKHEQLNYKHETARGKTNAGHQLFFLKASTELDGCSTVSDHFRGRITFCFQLSVQDSTSKTWSEDPWDRLVIEEWSSS